MVLLSQVSSTQPRFGMIELMLPVDANRPVPNAPRDDWGLLQARAIGEVFDTFVQRNGFKPQTMSQLMTFPGLDIPVYGHPYSSPRGDQTFESGDVPYAVSGRVVSRGNAFWVWMDETQLPYNTVLQVLNFFMRASQKMTGKPMQYKVTNTELQPIYELALVMMGRSVFPTSDGRPVNNADLGPQDMA